MAADLFDLDLEPDDSLPPALVPLVAVLPAEFKLPTLIKFVPNQALRVVAEEAAAQALAVNVQGPEGLAAADRALASLRVCQQAIVEHFLEPAQIAHALHAHITKTRGEWTEAGAVALQTVGGRMYRETHRLEQLAADQRRQAQAEADRLAKEQKRREAEAAQAAQAPVPVVEELRRQAETALAPPVAAVPVPALRGSAPVTTWKAQLVHTPADAEPNPEMEELTTEQRQAVLVAMQAVVEGRAPLLVFTLNWSYLNKRAVADKSTMAIPGFVSVETGGMRAKRGRKETR